MKELSLEVVKTFVTSQDKFSVNFEDAWQWCGYSRKDNAVKNLKNSFLENQDYLIFRTKAEKSKGRPTETYHLTADCFKELAMLAQTEQGKKVRLYFLECEKIAKQTPAPAPPKFSLIEALEMALASEKKALALQETNNKQLVKISELEPQAEAYKKLTSVGRSMDMGKVAKIFGIGRNTLFKYLRERKILMSGNHKYEPYQAYAKYFKLTLQTGKTETGKEWQELQLFLQPCGFAFINKVIQEYFNANPSEYPLFQKPDSLNDERRA
jgi:anti-repressor protein